MAVTTALIGCGGRGVNAQGEWARQSSKLELVAVCDLDDARRNAASERLQAPGVRDFRELLARPDLQSVLIATNAGAHALLAAEAIKAGKHVFIEKPLADTAETSFALAEAAEKAGIVGMVGYQFRLSGFGQTFHRLAQEIEPLQGLFTVQRGPMGPQYFSPEHYGGVVDTATHTIHLALWSMGGSPESAFAQIGRGRLQGDQTIEQFALIVEFDGGRSATLVSSMFGVQAGNTLQIIGRRGNMTTHDRRTIQVVRHEPITKPGSSNGPEGLNIEQVETAGEGDATGAMLDHFADLVSGASTEQLGTTLREGAQAVAVTQAMAQAAERGCKVAISGSGAVRPAS
jgi:predicted dehydrogenase